MAKKRKLKQQVNDDGYAEKIYNKIPCTVGYSYVRLEVDGNVRLCCISRHPVGNISARSFSDVWQGRQAYAFREKTARIHKEQFHLKDPEWGFCQQCSHISINFSNEEHMNFEKKSRSNKSTK